MSEQPLSLLASYELESTRRPGILFGIVEREAGRRAQSHQNALPSYKHAPGCAPPPPAIPSSTFQRPSEAMTEG